MTKYLKAFRAIIYRSKGATESANEFVVEIDNEEDTTCGACRLYNMGEPVWMEDSSSAIKNEEEPMEGLDVIP